MRKAPLARTCGASSFQDVDSLVGRAEPCGPARALRAFAARGGCAALLAGLIFVGGQLGRAALAGLALVVVLFNRLIGHWCSPLVASTNCGCGPLFRDSTTNSVRANVASCRR